MILIGVMILLSGQFLRLLAQTPPVALNGRLKLVGNQLCNDKGIPIQLRGISSHGLQWFWQCYSQSSLQTLTTDWGIDVFRAAMYVDEGGYLSDKTTLQNRVDQIVDWTEKAGIYCIVDWHILNPGNPYEHVGDAKAFFAGMAQKYAGKKHVIYEICNEPNGVTWGTIKGYAEEVIPVIRQYDNQAIILVGTPSWSGTPGDVVSSPLTGATAYNVLYTFHFYAGSHYSQNYIDGVIKQIPLFVSEWGTSNYSGNGGDDYTNAQNWMNLLGGANSSGTKVSWCNWSYCDKSETSASLTPGACSSGNWNSTSFTGSWVKSHLLTPTDSWDGGNYPPSITLTSPAGNTVYTAPATVQLSATATDGDGTVTRVEFYNGNTKIGEDSTSPYQFTWKNIGIGTYSLTASAVDNSMNVRVSDAKTITVVANQPPTLTITSPTNFAQFTAPASISIAATASDPDGAVAKVEFFNGSTKLYESSSSPYQYTWTNVGVGSYSITVKATDTMGESLSRTITVSVDSANTGADMIGPDIVCKNDVKIFELNAKHRTNATNYSWWCNGSTQSITPVSGQPWKCTYDFGNWFSGGSVCVGVNYSQSPWYKQICKTIAVCDAKGAKISMQEIDDETVVFPNPATKQFMLVADEDISGMSIVDIAGKTQTVLGAITKGTEVQFGNSLPAGDYFLTITYRKNDLHKSIHLVKLP